MVAEPLGDLVQIRNLPSPIAASRIESGPQSVGHGHHPSHAAVLEREILMAATSSAVVEI
jgi:hypothetical protein